MNIPFKNNLGGVMVNVPSAGAVDHGFDPLSSQTKDYKIVFVVLR